MLARTGEKALIARLCIGNFFSDQYCPTTTWLHHTVPRTATCDLKTLWAMHLDREGVTVHLLCPLLGTRAPAVPPTIAPAPAPLPRPSTAPAAAPPAAPTATRLALLPLLLRRRALRVF